MLLEQLLVQVLIAGVLSLLAYTTAVRYLGPARATAVTAIKPATATIASVFQLNEVPGVIKAGGTLFLICGVLLASGHL